MTVAQDLQPSPARPGHWAVRGPRRPASSTATARVPSPLGDLLLTASDGRLTGLYMTPHPELPSPSDRAGGDAEVDGEGDAMVLAAARRQLDEYFAGERRVFALPLAPEGTEFQRQVWAALCDIPYGRTSSYGELARRIGRPGAARAVGLANGRNPVAVVIPCHRVIGADGSLTGYGGGLDRKRLLLALESGQPALEV